MSGVVNEVAQNTHEIPRRRLHNINPKSKKLFHLNPFLWKSKDALLRHIPSRSIISNFESLIWLESVSVNERENLRMVVFRLDHYNIARVKL